MVLGQCTQCIVAWSVLCDHCHGQTRAWGALSSCILLLRSSLFEKCCRLLQAGKEVLWHREDNFKLFDGKGGVQTISSQQADTVGVLLSGAGCSRQII